MSTFSFLTKKNGVDKFIDELHGIIAEYSEYSTQISAEAQKNEDEFEKKYKECVAAPRLADIVPLKREYELASKTLVQRESDLCSGLKQRLGMVGELRAELAIRYERSPNMEGDRENGFIE